MMRLVMHEFAWMNRMDEIAMRRWMYARIETGGCVASGFRFQRECPGRRYQISG